MKKEIQPRMLRMRDLISYCALSRAYLYAKINEGSFPPGHMISPGIRIWYREDIDSWIDARIGRA